MRLATYNILHGSTIGSEGAGAARAFDPALLPAAAASLQADVLGLQEVDLAQPRSGGRHQVQDVARAMAAPEWRFAPSVRGTPGDPTRQWSAATGSDEPALNGPATVTHEPWYGVGMVTQLPVTRWATTRFGAAPASLPLLVTAGSRSRLLMVPDEPRAVIAAVVSSLVGQFTVATGHLSFVPGWNVHQLRQLARRLKDWPRPLFLLGDLNLPWALPSLVTGWTELVREPTYPSTGPKVQFDHILADGLTAAQLRTVVGQVHQLGVSDHAAVTVDIDLDAT